MSDGFAPSRPGALGSMLGGASRAAAASRFIPRDELQGFTSWQPDPLTTPTQRPAETLSQAHVDVAAAQARKEGYEAGYRDGLKGLAEFKASYLQEAGARVGQFMAALDDAMNALEQTMATRLAHAATELAQHVVRDELRTDPARIATVAQEAVHSVVLSAKHVVVHVHPDDEAWVQEGAREALQARGARCEGDATLQRGDVFIESDVGTVDARVATRWRQVAGVLGTEMPWQASDPPKGDTP